jgi:hypothetical protein
MKVESIRFESGKAICDLLTFGLYKGEIFEGLSESKLVEVVDNDSDPEKGLKFLVQLEKRTLQESAKDRSSAIDSFKNILELTGKTAMNAITPQVYQSSSREAM